jgi:hypothetical protein
MFDETGFPKELEDTINNADEKVDKKELLEDIFKSYVAKLFEVNIKNKRLPYGVLVEVKKLLISAFRAASLDVYQRSVGQYEEMFDNTVQEIIDFASGQNDEGEDIVEQDPNQRLEVNVKEYENLKNASDNSFEKNDSGIYVPKE